MSTAVPEIAAATLAELRHNGWGKGGMALVDYDSLPDNLWADYDPAAVDPYSEYGGYGQPAPEAYATCTKCLAGGAAQVAMGDATKAEWWSGFTPDFVHFLEAVVAKIGPVGQVWSETHPHLRLVRHITAWNDADARTFADVERLLEDLAAGR